MEKYLNILANAEIFKGIDKDDILQLIKQCGGQVKSFDKNEPVFLMHSTIKSVCIVVKGSIKVQRIDESGENTVVDIIKTGDIFGEAYAFAKTLKIPATVVANEPSKILFVDSVKLVYGEGRVKSAVALNIITNMAKKLVNLNQKLYILQKSTIRDKVTAFFEQRRHLCGELTFTLPFNKTAFAEYLGVNRSALSRELSKMQSEKLVIIEGSVVTLNDNFFE